MTDIPQTFLDLGVSAPFVNGLEKLGISKPTPVQTAAYRILLEKKNAYLRAETGTGKTLAYLLPILGSLDPNVPETHAVIVAPTHELAIQIQRHCTDLAQHAGIPVKVLLLIGGTSKDRQIEKLKKKPHIVVGSPGRILELIQEKKLKAHTFKRFVIDEADRMLNAETLPMIRQIVKASPRELQFIFVSASDQDAAHQEVKSLAKDVVFVDVAASPVNENIEHLYITCEERDKPDLMRRLFHALKPNRALVFVHKNETAEIVAEKLAHHKIPTADIHAARDKEARKAAMDNFRKGAVAVLIASDVAARGLDIKGVTHVFNLDMPTDPKSYIHRVGRTGRAGEKGIAVSIVTDVQLRLLPKLKRDLGIELIQISLRQGQAFVVHDESSRSNPTENPTESAQ